MPYVRVKAGRSLCPAQDGAIDARRIARVQGSVQSSG